MKAIIGFSFVFLLFASCGQALYTSNDVAGVYKLQFSRYGGLMHSNTNAVFTFQKDSVLTIQACGYTEGKWYVDDHVLYYEISKTDSVGNQHNIKEIGKIAKNKIYLRKEYYVAGKKVKRNSTKSAVLVKQS